MYKIVYNQSVCLQLQPNWEPPKTDATNWATKYEKWWSQNCKSNVQYLACCIEMNEETHTFG